MPANPRLPFGEVATGDSVVEGPLIVCHLERQNGPEGDKVLADLATLRHTSLESHQLPPVEPGAMSSQALAWFVGDRASAVI